MVESVPGPETLPQRQRRRRLSLVRGRDGACFLDLRTRGRISEKRWLAKVWDRRLRQYRTKVHRTIEEAEAWAEEEMARFSLRLSSAGALALASLIGPYRLELERRSRSPKHCIEVTSVMQEAVDAGVSDLKADSLKDDVRRWLAGMRDVSASTRNKRLTILHGAVRFALGEGLVSVDPMAGLRGETEAAKGQLREVFTPDELHLLVSDAHKAHDYWPEAVLLVYCGMRVGEASHAQWSWFDWDGRVVRVKQGDGFSPKRHQERTIPLLAEAIDILKPMANLAGRVSKRLNPSPGQASREFAAYAKAVGVVPRGRGAHCVRHSYVSYRLALGIPSLVVQRDVGHSTIVTTQKYAHAIPAAWLDGWPLGGKGEFWLRRRPPVSAADASQEKPRLKRKR
jgi:integrase